MTINNTDKFLVNRSNASYQIEAQALMAKLQDTDLMLVNRDGASFKLTGADIKSSLVLDTDLLLVNRDGVSYKATGAEIKDSLGSKGTPNKSLLSQMRSLDLLDRFLPYQATKI